MANIDAMQQEAMRRVQAMQSKVPPRQNTSPQAAPKRETRQTTAPPAEKEPVRPPAAEQYREPAEQGTALPANSAGSTIDFLLKDKEQNLILLLIILLAGDETDRGLLLALIYLLI